MNVIESKTVSILIVDDDPQICEMLSSILSKEDFQVVSTFRSNESLGFLKKGSYVKFNLVITDLQMPGLGGFSIIKNIQADSYESVPVLVMTGRNLDAGTIDMIKNEPNVKTLSQKPLFLSDFISTVYSALGILPKPENHPQETPVHPQASPQPQAT